jgi:hypothetical protein
MAAVVAFNDELSVVISSWLEGRPRMLVKLEVALPKVDADYCGVLVLRFPTPYNPTKNGRVEVVYKGLHRPGEVAVAKNMLFAVVVKHELDEKTGEYRVGYYEPQEYPVFVHCVKNGRMVFEWRRTIEVFPNSIIYTKRVVVSEKGSTLAGFASPQNGSPGRVAFALDEGSSAHAFTCSIVIEEEGYDYKKGLCHTWVRGPWLYSISGLQVRFGLIGRIPPSAVYLEHFCDSEMPVPTRNEREVNWQSCGKKITPSVISGETSPVSGYYRDRVYFQVRYIYEWARGCYDGVAGVCYQYWLLYPAEIGSVALSSEEPQIPDELSSWYPPSQIPYYASPGGIGVTEIYFSPTSESNEVITGIEVTFSFSWGPATLTVALYKSVRSDTQYDTPYVKIDASRYYWWWYRDNDKRNLEVIVAPR